METPLLTIETCRLRRLMVFDTEKSFLGEQIYCVDTVDNNGLSNIRFGNKTQLISILRTYKYSVKQEFKKDYEKFMEDLLK